MSQARACKQACWWLIVEELRTAVQHNSDPGSILSAFKNQLCEREHASATCMVLRFMRAQWTGEGAIKPVVEPQPAAIWVCRLS